MAVSADYQMEWQSLKIGPDTDYPILRIEGLADPPEPRTYEAPRIATDGAIVLVDDKLEPRVVTVDLEVEGTSASDAQSNLDALKNAMSLTADTIVLQFQLPGQGVRQIDCYPRRMSAPVEEPAAYGVWQRVRIQFFAPVPTIFSGTQQSQSTS